MFGGYYFFSLTIDFLRLNYSKGQNVVYHIYIRKVEEKFVVKFESLTNLQF